MAQKEDIKNRSPTCECIAFELTEALLTKKKILREELHARRWCSGQLVDLAKNCISGVVCLIARGRDPNSSVSELGS